MHHLSLEYAKQLINKAEADLGPLSTGQKRDLLADHNPTRSLAAIRDIVAWIEKQGQWKEKVNLKHTSIPPIRS